jgi:hypothetical protein
VAVFSFDDVTCPTAQFPRVDLSAAGVGRPAPRFLSPLAGISGSIYPFPTRCTPPMTGFPDGAR